MEFVSRSLCASTFTGEHYAETLQDLHASISTRERLYLRFADDDVVVMGASECERQDVISIRYMSANIGILEITSTPNGMDDSKNRLWAKTINVFRACLGAQLTICAQK